MSEYLNGYFHKTPRIIGRGTPDKQNVGVRDIQALRAAFDAEYGRPEDLDPATRYVDPPKYNRQTGRVEQVFPLFPEVKGRKLIQVIDFNQTRSKANNEQIAV